MKKLGPLENLFFEKLLALDSVDVSDFIGTGIDESNIDEIAATVTKALSDVGLDGVQIEFVSIQ